MSARPWMPLYVSDYLGDTGHLSTVEHGAYLLLIMHYWQNTKLPADDAKLARIARLTADEWADIRSTLAELFDDGWRHTRIDAEIAKAEETISKRSAAGKAAANARRTNEQANVEQSSTIAPSGDKQSQLPRARASHSPSEKNISHPSDARPPDEKPDDDLAQDAVQIFNASAIAAGWPEVKRLTRQRRAAVLARLRECGGIEGWRAAMDRARQSAFLCGSTGWKADFDFFCQSKSFTKLMEGSYDDHKPTANGKQSAHETFLRSIATVVAKRAGNGGGEASANGRLHDQPGLPPPLASLADDLEIPAILRRGG